jgi:hypothetical protein
LACQRALELIRLALQALDARTAVAAEREVAGLARVASGEARLVVCERAVGAAAGTARAAEAARGKRVEQLGAAAAAAAAHLHGEHEEHVGRLLERATDEVARLGDACHGALEGVKACADAAAAQAAYLLTLWPCPEWARATAWGTSWAPLALAAACCSTLRPRSLLAPPPLWLPRGAGGAARTARADRPPRHAAGAPRRH